MSAKKKERFFYILLYVFLHFRRKFGEPFSALGTRTGNSVCLVACRHYCSNVNDSVASASFSKSLKSRQNALHGQGMLGWAGLLCGPRGDLWGSPFPAELWSSHLECWELGLEGSCFMWMKERQCGSDVNCKLISLAWGGILSFTRAATDKFDIGNQVCVCAVFSFIIARKGRKSKASFGTIKHFSLVSCLE